MKKVLLVLILVSAAAVGLSAQRTITGIVTDENKEPLIGATVLVEGAFLGTITDVSGEFRLTVPEGANTLLISYTGFTTRRVDLTSATNYSVQLASDAVTLSDIVVVAYGTARKEALTGSVGSIKSEAIERRPVNNVTTVIEGASPGVVTTTANGQPGSGLGIRIRGFGSINATQEPLYVVDGVPYVGGTSNINPDDVGSIGILKDASATALYGSRAANGVVMITTKQGKKGRNNVSLKVAQGFATRGLPEYERVDAFDYYPLIWESYRNSLVYPVSGTGISRDSANRVASGLTTRTGVTDLLAYNPSTCRVNRS